MDTNQLDKILTPYKEQLSQAIEMRISRRTYLDQFMSEEKAKQIQSAIDAANQDSGLSITLIQEGAAVFRNMRKSYGLFKNVRHLIVLKGPKSDPHLKEKAGYYGEALVLLATLLELGTCWVSGTFDSKSSKLQLTPSESLVCVIAIGPIEESLTGKERLIRTMSHRKHKTAAQMSLVQGSAPEWFQSAMVRVARAPSAVNSQKSLFTFSAGQVGAEIKNDNYNDLIDLGIAKYHFECDLEGQFELGNPSVFRSRA